MKYPEIKFSHEYFKFGDWLLPMQVELLQVFKVHKKDLSKEFIEYDTVWGDASRVYNYELPNTDLIVILLKSLSATKTELVTTIRRFTPRKWKYYKSLEGKEVRLRLV